MKKKKNIISISLAIIIGIVIGRYVFNEYKISADTIDEDSDLYVYLMQYGVYSTKENMISNTESLVNYFYYQEDDGYHVLIGITKNESLKDKIVDCYNIKDNIYMKSVKIDNEEFLTALQQYDSLISSLEDSQTIINAEKQILSKYEELVLNGE